MESQSNEPRKVTPAQAKKWLAENRGNRTISEKIVLTYAIDMEAGKWQLTGDPIRIAKDGTLLDGQHRLEACVLSGKPFWTYVMEGCDPKVKWVIDTGLKRQMKDVLKMQGEVNSTLLAATLNWLIRYDENGTRIQRGITHNESLSYLSENPTVRDSVQFASAIRSRLKLVTATIVGGTHCVVARGDRHLADNFWKSLATGVDLQPRDPIFIYRRWLERNYYGDRKASSTVNSAVAIKAINAWLEGKEMQSLGWRPAGGEEFPRLIVPDGVVSDEVTGEDGEETATAA